MTQIRVATGGIPVLSLSEGVLSLSEGWPESECKMLGAVLDLTPIHTLHSAAQLTHKDVRSGKSETILCKVEIETWLGHTKEKLQSDKLPREEDNT